MEPITEGFGFNTDLFETNILNLAVVLAVVFSLGKDVLTSMLENRREKIVNSLQSADDRFKQAQLELDAAVNEYNLATEKVKDIQIEGRQMIEALNQEGKKRCEEAITRLESLKEETVRLEEEKAISEVTNSMVADIMSGAEKILTEMATGDVLTCDLDKLLRKNPRQQFIPGETGSLTFVQPIFTVPSLIMLSARGFIKRSFGPAPGFPNYPKGNVEKSGKMGGISTNPDILAALNENGKSDPNGMLTKCDKVFAMWKNACLPLPNRHQQSRMLHQYCRMMDRPTATLLLRSMRYYYSLLFGCLIHNDQLRGYKGVLYQTSPYELQERRSLEVKEKMNCLIEKEENPELELECETLPLSTYLDYLSFQKYYERPKTGEKGNIFADGCLIWANWLKKQSEPKRFKRYDYYTDQIIGLMVRNSENQQYLEKG